jgi:hypothetical protein
MKRMPSASHGFVSTCCRPQRSRNCAMRSGATPTRFYVIIDFEHPRLGILRIGDFDRLIMDVRATMS